MSGRTGVYAVLYPAGVYVGETVDYERRNRTAIAGGLAAPMIVDMPGSSDSERMAMETQIADECARFGFVVISRNTSERRKAAGCRGHTAETRAKIGAVQRGKPKPAAWVAKMRLISIRNWQNPVVRQRMIEGISRAQRARWARERALRDQRSRSSDRGINGVLQP